MTPSYGPYGQSPNAKQRPIYLPASAAANGYHDRTRSTPTRLSAPPSALHSASPKNATSSGLLAHTPTMSASPSGSRVHRLPHGSPSAYQRFDEVAWIVDLSSRIGDALVSPAHTSVKPSDLASASSSSTPQALIRSQSRVRLPRPSKEFRELQQRVQLSRGSEPSLMAADTSISSAASLRADDPDDSAIQWAQHAQQDFDRRRAELQRSRQGILKPLEGDREDQDGDEPQADAAAESAVDPAVQRSLLAARSLQELIHVGGFQAEDDDNAEAGFANLLDSAEALPGGAAELGPSSLFETNRASDGSLDIESILKQRARMAAVEDQAHASASRPTSSMLNLSQAPSPSVKRPVIEVLDAGTPHDAGQTTRSSNSDSRAPSEASASSSDSQEAPSADQLQLSPASQQRSVPQPMDQIAIVNGIFQIIPAQSHPSFDSRQSTAPARHNVEASDAEAASDDDDDDEEAVGQSQGEELDDASEEEGSDENEDSEEEEEDGDEDEDEEMDDSAEQGFAARAASRQYHDGFGGVSTRDLLSEGPAGDADEPIVLSDSEDEPEDDDPADGQGQSEEDDEQDSDEDDQDELAHDSEDESEDDRHRSAEAEQEEMGVSTQYENPSLAQQALREQDEQEDQDEDMAEDDGAEQAVSMEAQGSDPFHPDVDNVLVAGLNADRLDGPIQKPFEAAAASTAASNVSNGFLSGSHSQLPADLEGDGVPDSEVEPEELDEDLRWSDIEADQGDDGDPTAPQDLDQLAPADAAYRSIQGSQAMPGFVSAAHILADMQAADAEAKIGDPVFNDVPRREEGPIDPQLLSDVGSETVAGATSTTDDAATAAPLETQGTSDSQTEADIFDAFTRQDAASETREPLDEGQEDGGDLLRADVNANQENDVAAPEEAEAITPVSAFQPEEAVSDEVAAAAVRKSASPPIREEARPTVMASEEGGEEDNGLDEPVQDQAGEAQDHPLTDKLDGAVASQDEAVETVETQETSNASPPHQAQEEHKAQAPSTDAEEPATKPVLLRVESTDVLEADVEDNGEEEAAPEEAAIHRPSASVLAALAAKADPESEADVPGESTMSVTDADDDTNEPAAVDNEASSDEAEAVHVSVPLEVLVQAQEEEAILSGDLADRDSSIERQAGSTAAESRVAHRDKENRVQSDQDLAFEPAEAEADSPSDAAVETDEVEPSPTEVEQAAPGTDRDSAEQDPQLAEDHVREDVPGEEPPTSIAPAAPTLPESKEESKNAVETPAPHQPIHLSPVRVPASPASSDRRSTSSFTPTANRQGNRHLHGAAKRSFFAQVTEAASGFASNLTAPLRAIPSLLPISEKPSQETREGDETTKDAAPVENVSQDDAPAESQRPTNRSNKPAEAAKFTMNTRSHCICRKLQLTKVEGAPIFIVPGCSIDYQKAQAEAAEDLGPTDESLAEEWLTVDPDLLPMDVHHMLSRVIGLQFLNEGICVEPGSSAAGMVFAGWDLDEDLLSSRDEPPKRDPDMAPDLVADEQAPTDVLKQKALAHQTEGDADDADPKETEAATTAEAAALDRDTQRQEPETPSRATRRSARHRRNSSVASASSPHRSPHHPGATSPNADYLPDDERRRLRKDRHPATPARGDVSIASLEEHFRADKDAEDFEPEDRVLMQEAEQEPSSPRAKRKRARGRESTTTASQLAQKERERDREDAEKAKKTRGRTSTAPGAVATDEAPVEDPKDIEEAAMVEDALERAAPPSKRPRRGRKTQEAADADGSQQEATTGGEEEGDRSQGRSRRTRTAKANEENASQETDGKPEDEAVSEAKQTQKGRQGGKGGRKRKQSVDQEETETATEAVTPVEKVAKGDDADSVKAQPRRSRRSQGGTSAQSPSPSKASPGKASKRKNILKLS